MAFRNMVANKTKAAETVVFFMSKSGREPIQISASADRLIRIYLF